MPVLKPNVLIDERVTAIRAYHAKAGLPRAELDVSGGIDSAVVLGLLSRALGPERITAVYSSIHSSDASCRRARLAASAFQVDLLELELGDVFEALVLRMQNALVGAGHDERELSDRLARDPTVLGSFRSCLRAPLGRGLNRMAGGGIRHGTGNECEDRWLRFYQKGGDGEVDTNPIAMLSKGEVYQLGLALGVPRELVEALPTPDLHGVGEAHNDEEELFTMSGVRWTYSRVDLQTGRYSVVGTIEMLSRFLDRPAATPLFAAPDPNEATWSSLVEAARGLFVGHPPDAVLAFLRSARRMEAFTRHKLNPAIPTLGSRAKLVADAIVSDELPGQ